MKSRIKINAPQTEPLRRQLRKLSRFTQRDSCVYISFVVYPFRLMLALGARRFNSLSYHLALVVTFPDCRNRRSRSFGAGLGSGHASRKIIERAVSNLKNSNSK